MVDIPRLLAHIEALEEELRKVRPVFDWPPPKEVAAVYLENKRLVYDVEAYRGALGYPVRGDHDGRLSDGTAPINGIAQAREAHIEALEEAVSGVTDRCEQAFRQLGMDGPDKSRMGEVWFDAYALCKAALQRLQERGQ